MAVMHGLGDVDAVGCPVCGWHGPARRALVEPDEVVRCPRCGEPVLPSARGRSPAESVIGSAVSFDAAGGPRVGLVAEAFYLADRLLYRVIVPGAGARVLPAADCYRWKGPIPNG